MRKNKRMHWLAHIINHKKYRIGAEVGAATGVTTKWLLDNCPTLGQLIIADDWRPIPNSGQWEMDNMEQIFRNKFKGEKRLLILKGLSWQMASRVPDISLDFVFIDASHDYESVKKDLKAWDPKIRPGGLLCGHDLHFEGVREALAELPETYFETGIDNTWFIPR